MKQEDKQYEKWLTEIKSNQPILENPEELTATILNRISGISPERKRRKFLIGAWASGIAASLLLLLLINDTCFTSVPHRTEMQNEYDNWSNSIPLPDNWEEMRLLEKNTYLSSTIKFNFWGEEEKLNVKACQKLSGVDGEYFTVAKGKEHLSAMAIPMERVKKSFRWFYTYYIYTATYKELQDKGPVPLDNYLNKEEQMIWLQGNDDAFRGMNGIEMNDKLDKLEAKFGEWYNRSIYEINWEVIHHFASLQGDTACLQCLKELKNSVYKKHSSEKGDSMGDADIEEVCNMFDKACSTKYFSDLYKTNKEMMDALCEEKINIAEIFYHAIQFELTMPGRLLTSNAKVLKDDVVIWKIDGFRLLAGDYVLTAESRIINYWAFGITLFIMLFVLGVFIKLYRKRS